MKVSWIVLALLVSAAVFLASNLVFSTYNSAGYAALLDHHERLAANIEDLHARRNELGAQADLLARSGEAVRLEARRLQLYQDGEQVVRIDGYDADDAALSPGRVLRGRPLAGDSSLTARVAAVVAGIVTLVVLMMVDHPRQTQGKAPHHAGEIRRASR